MEAEVDLSRKAKTCNLGHQMGLGGRGGLMEGLDPLEIGRSALWPR